MPGRGPSRWSCRQGHLVGKGWPSPEVPPCDPWLHLKVRAGGRGRGSGNRALEPGPEDLEQPNLKGIREGLSP